MTKNNSTVAPVRQIDSTELQAVTGGAGKVHFPNMGGPKYSAAWWELVRARGLHL